MTRAVPPPVVALQSRLLTLVNLRKLHQGFRRISFDDFASANGHAADPKNGYLELQWIDFQRDPVRYTISRNPEEHGEALFDLARAKGGI